MPLSRIGIAEITTAAQELGIVLSVLNASALYTLADAALDSLPYGESRSGHTDLERALAAELIAAGVTVHYPAIIVHREGHVLGDAIAGYKTAAAYEAMIAKRLALYPAERTTKPSGAMTPDFVAGGVRSDSPVASVRATTPPVSDRDVTVEDIPVAGRPGPYFRFVHGRGAVAFESGRVIYLLDLGTGTTQVAPGFVDFVPSPDGQFFVTPAAQRGGLEFYDADEVSEEAAQGTGASVRPLYVDREMRDQYPSVGVLDAARESGAPNTTYRVLTSWFDKVIFRDYDVRLAAGGSPSVRPLGPPVVACPNLQVSLPIIAPNGRELAARDEATATTKIFRLSGDGTCTELIDTGLQTGKVAWTADGHRIAFAIPQGVVSDGAGVLWRGVYDGCELTGIFVLNRDEFRLTRVPRSEDVNRLAFPEFVGRDSIMFLLSQADSSSRFRIVCCIR